MVLRRDLADVECRRRCRGPGRRPRVGRARRWSAPGRRRSASRRRRTGARRPRGRPASRSPRPRRPAAGRRRGAGSSAVSSQAVSMVASRNSSLATSARRKPVLVVRPRIAVSSRAATRPRRAASRSAPCDDDLAQHRVVRRADDLAALEGVVDPGGRGPAHDRGGAGLRQEAVEGVLGVDPGLDGVPVEADVVLGEAAAARRRPPAAAAGPGRGAPRGSRWRARRAGHHDDRLGDRVLDLQAGVHLEEVDLAGSSASSSRNSTVPAFT